MPNFSADLLCGEYTTALSKVKETLTKVLFYLFFLLAWAARRLNNEIGFCADAKVDENHGCDVADDVVRVFGCCA